MNANDTTTQTIRAIIADVLEVDPALVQADTNFVLDLGADSLRIIEILSRLEAALKVQIDQSQLARMISLSTVREVVDQSMAAA